MLFGTMYLMQVSDIKVLKSIFIINSYYIIELFFSKIEYLFYYLK